MGTDGTALEPHPPAATLLHRRHASKEAARIFR